jgi:hypothetical protein
MKTKVLLAAVFVAGLATSFAVASPAKKPPQGSTSGTTATGTTSSTAPTEGKKVTLCHKTGSKSHPWVKIRVSKNAVKAHMAHGDIALSANGECPKTPGAGGGTTSGTTTGATSGTTTQPGHGKGKGKDKGKEKDDDDEDGS